MAFATKYTIDFEDYDLSAWSVDFQEDNWGGGETSFTPGSNPVVIKWNASDKYQTIVGSSCDIQMVYESGIDSLYTEDDQDIKVIVKKGVTTRWTGWLLPGQYTRHFNQPKHYVTLTASDGLAQLKEIPFEDGSGDPYYYQTTEILTIANILDKTSLGFGILDGVNIYESSGASANTDSPFALTYLYPEHFWDEVTDERSDCYTVLGAILKKYGARICQWGAQWRIVRPNASIQEDVRHRIFNAAGAYSSTSTHPGYTTLSSESLQYLHGDAELTKHRGRGSAEITLSPQIRGNILKNGTFDDFTYDGSDIPYYWAETLSPTYEHSSEANVLRMASNGLSAAPTKYIGCTFGLFKPTAIRIILNYKAVYSGSPTHAKVTMILLMNSIDYYIANETWITTAPPAGGWYRYDMIAESKATMTAFEDLVIDVAPKHASEGWGTIPTFELRLYEFHNETGGAGNYVAIKNIRVEADYAGDVKTEKIYTFTGPGAIKNIHKDSLSLGDSYLDEEVVFGNDDMWYGTTTAVGRGSETDTWFIKGDNETATTPVAIAELLAKQRTEGFWRSMDLLSATFKGGTNLTITEGIQDPNFTDEYGYNKTFFPLGVQMDIGINGWSGEWVECTPIYNTTGGTNAWAGETYTDATITANSIEVNNSPGDGGAFFESYTAVAGETLRFVVTLTDDGSSDLPSLAVTGDPVSMTWGVNYISYFCSAAGAKQIQLGSDDGGDNHNLTCEVDFYYLTGI